MEQDLGQGASNFPSESVPIPLSACLQSQPSWLGPPIAAPVPQRSFEQRPSRWLQLSPKPALDDDHPRAIRILNTPESEIQSGSFEIPQHEHAKELEPVPSTKRDLPPSNVIQHYEINQNPAPFAQPLGTTTDSFVAPQQPLEHRDTSSRSLVAKKATFRHKKIFYTFYESSVIVALYVSIRRHKPQFSRPQAYDTVNEVIRYQRATVPGTQRGTFGPALDCEGLMKRLMAERMAYVHTILNGANKDYWYNEASLWYWWWMRFMGTVVAR